jgi:nicotinamide-nucleotide amidase
MDMRRLHTAEILSIGTEVTVGETLDTNAGVVARSLAASGLEIGRVVALPDDVGVVATAIRDALGRADLVVTGGGLGPTPDDLTREAIAAVVGQTPAVDPDLEATLRQLFARRGIVIPERNLKQAWLIPSAAALPNAHGTAPGWWVEAGDGRVIVALPGPPRELVPMWSDLVLPRVLARVARARVSRTLRLTGIGESHVAERIGDELLGATNPTVATYARADAVDVRISAVDPDDPAGPTAVDLVAAAEARVLLAVGDHVWGSGTDTWADMLDGRLAAAGWDLAIAEAGTAGSLGALLASARTLRHAASWREAADLASDDPIALAEATRAAAGASVGLALITTPRGDDTQLEIGVVTPHGARRESGIAFLRGPQGSHRAALSAASVLRDELLRHDAAGG